MCRVTVLPLSESVTLVVPVGAAERLTLGEGEGGSVTGVPGPLEAEPATPTGEGVGAGVGLGVGAKVGNGRELEGAVKV